MNGCDVSERRLYFQAVLRCTTSSIGQSKPKPCHWVSTAKRSHNATCALLHTGISEVVYCNLPLDNKIEGVQQDPGCPCKEKSGYLPTSKVSRTILSFCTLFVTPFPITKSSFAGETAMLRRKSILLCPLTQPFSFAVTDLKVPVLSLVACNFRFSFDLNGARNFSKPNSAEQPKSYTTRANIAGSQSARDIAVREDDKQRKRIRVPRLSLCFVHHL